MKDDQDRCVAAGMDGYLSKPVHSADLLAMIEALDKRQELSAAVRQK
jgi:CheY-like chemotaxis protein